MSVPAPALLSDIATFTLFYRQGMNPHPLTKNFHMQIPKDMEPREIMRKAISRGQHHCELMGYRFISIRPFLSDLDLDEKKVSDG